MIKKWAEAQYIKAFKNHTLSYLAENSLKSASRSQILRPVREALLEYVGPIPFFVVPMLWDKKYYIQTFLRISHVVQEKRCVENAISINIF